MQTVLLILLVLMLTPVAALASCILLVFASLYIIDEEPTPSSSPG